MARKDIKDRRRVELIEANMASIAKRGFSETTIAHVAEGAGLSRGIVNFYFTTKEIMMQETLNFLLEEYAAAWNKAMTTAQGSAVEKLKALVEADFSNGVLNRRKIGIWMAFMGEARSNKTFAGLLQQSEQRHTEALREAAAKALEERQITHIGAEAFALSMHALVRGLWNRFYLEGDGDARESMKEAAWLFAESVFAAPASEQQDDASPNREAKVIQLESKRPKEPARTAEDDAQLNLLGF